MLYVKRLTILFLLGCAAIAPDTYAEWTGNKIPATPSSPLPQCDQNQWATDAKTVERLFKEVLGYDHPIDPIGVDKKASTRLIEDLPLRVVGNRTDLRYFADDHGVFNVSSEYSGFTHTGKACKKGDTVDIEMDTFIPRGPIIISRGTKPNQLYMAVVNFPAYSNSYTMVPPGTALPPNSGGPSVTANR